MEDLTGICRLEYSRQVVIFELFSKSDMILPEMGLKFLKVLFCRKELEVKLFITVTNRLIHKHFRFFKIKTFLSLNEFQSFAAEG